MKFYRLSTALFLLTLAWPGASAIADDGFRLIAIAERAEGRTLLAGDYRQALDRLEHRASDGFAYRSNLCVAFAMAHNLDRAMSECDAALGLVEREVAEVSRSTIVDDADLIVIALSNRGVLRALRGDLEGARSDFTRARSLGGQYREPRINEAHLETLAS